MIDPPPLSVVVLISGGGTNLQAIIDAAQGSMPVDIAAVISNRPGVKGLERAAKAGIAAQVLDHRDFTERGAFDHELMMLIDQYHPGLVVLAGYMRILTADFVHHYSGRILNIHPSLLPKYPGLHTHQRVLDSDDTLHGATIHFVTEQLDGGPPIVQAQVRVEPGDNVETLSARVLEKEHQIYSLAIGWFAEKRLRLDENGDVILDKKRLKHPVVFMPQDPIA
jgi:phosphoribosylglycinamide formyltransferase-1